LSILLLEYSFIEPERAALGLLITTIISAMILTGRCFGMLQITKK
jgi:hypothetical protein